MKTEVYLIVNDRGLARITKRWPALARDEIGVKLKLTVPDGCFRAPILRAELSVREDQVIEPTLEIEIMDAPPRESVDAS